LFPPSRPQLPAAWLIGLSTQPNNHVNELVNKKLKNEVYNIENFLGGSVIFSEVEREICQSPLSDEECEQQSTSK
jgi:hypothetical protein